MGDEMVEPRRNTFRNAPHSSQFLGVSGPASQQPRPRLAVSISLLLAVGLTSGTGCEAPRGRRAAVIDELPVLTATEALRIGSVEDPDLGFSRVTGVDVDRDGNLFVGESLAGEIRVFDPDGNLLNRIGRRGEGPGEFNMPLQWGVLGDTVWVVDFQLQRTTLFDRGGTLLSTGAWAGVPVLYGTSGSAGAVGPVLMRADGLFMSEVMSFSSSIGGTPSPDSVRVPKLLFDATGAVLDTVGWDVRPPEGQSRTERVQGGSRRYSVPRPPSGNVPRLWLPGGRWVVDGTVAGADTTSSLTVWRLGLSEDTLFTREYRYLPTRYPETVLDSIALRSAPGVSSAESATADAVRRAIRNAMDFPDFQPPVVEGVAGADGTLWLRREDTGGPSYRWFVIAPDGTPRGHVNVPRKSRVSWVSEGGFVVVERDEFDVPWVVRFHLEG